MNPVTLPRSLLLLFALPAVAQSLMHTPAQSLLQGVYAKHAGLELAALGFALMLVRVWDAVIDPLIGYAADWTYPRLRSRKPWLLGGSAVSIVGLWFLFRPPAGVTVGWFAFWYLVASTGWSMVEISYRAWSLEITRDYVQRNRIQVWIAMLAAVGGIALYSVPLAAKALGLAQTTEFDLGSLGLLAIVIAVLLPALNLLAAWKVPDGEMEPPPPRDDWRAVWRSIAGNGPLLQFALVFLVFSVAGGLCSSGYYLFVDTWLGLSDKVPYIMVATIPGSLLAIPFWGWLCNRYERHKVWAIAIGVLAVLLAANGFLPRGEAAIIPAAVINFGFAVCLVTALVIAPAMLGDIIDYGRLHYDRNRAGTYFSLYTLLMKTVQGLMTGFGLVLLGWFGFDASATEQTASGEMGIKLVVGWLPALGLACMVPMVWRFPISRARHAQIVEELARKATPA